MRNVINLFAFVLALTMANVANAQPAPANFTVSPTAVGGAQVSGDVPNNANLTINLGSAPAPSVPAPQQPAAPSAPVPAPAVEETCSVGWCPFVTTGSWIAGIGAILLEVGLIALGLFAVLGGLWYLMRRFGERRHDRTWHHRNAFLAGRYREALVACGALEDNDPDHIIWARRAERRYAQLLGHGEQDGRPTAAADLPVPPPLTGVDEDADA